MISVMVETVLLRRHGLIGPGVANRKLATYLRGFVHRNGVLNIYTTSPSLHSHDQEQTVVMLATETAASACLMALSKLPDGGVSASVRYPPKAEAKPVDPTSHA